MEVKRILAQDAYPVRQTVLAPQGNNDYYRYEGDMDEKTFHLGCFEDKKLVSVGSFYFEKNPILEDAYQYRLRGMATYPEFRGKGFGSMLLQTAIPHIVHNQCSLVWCYARKTHFSFYEKMGFSAVGEPFTKDDTGYHQLYVKKLLDH